MFRRSSLVFVAIASLVGAMPVFAATFSVDSTADSPSAEPGDGTCLSKAGGCTLRAAVQEANASSVGNTIQIPSGTYTLAIAPEGADFGRSGSLFLKGEVTIEGASATDTVIDGGGLARVFEIAQGSTVAISGVTVRGGAAKGGDGGGLLNRGSLNLQESTFSGNSATADPGQSNGRGGAIHNEGKISAMLVTLNENRADGRGGALFNAPGASVEMINGRIAGNLSLTDEGGAVLNAGTLSLTMLPVRGNKASGGGGGVANVGGDLTLFDVALLENEAGANGGGLRNSGTAKLTNVTIGTNQAGASGGGIDNDGAGTLRLNNVTVVRNKAGTLQTGVGGGIHNGAGSVSIVNTLLAENLAGQARSDCSGKVESRGFNLVATPMGCGIVGEGAGNVLGKPAGLGKLEAHGGPVPSYALLPESMAIDAGNPAKPTGKDGTCALADQRGTKRPQAGRPGASPRCDIGAFEVTLKN